MSQRRMSGIETRLYIRKSTDHPVIITVEPDHLPREGYILRFAAAGEGSDIAIWLSAEHARAVTRALTEALAET